MEKREETLEEKIASIILNNRYRSNETLDEFVKAFKIPKEILKKLERAKFKITLED